MKFDESSTMLEPMRTTFMQSHSQLKNADGKKSPSKHHLHRTEEIHTPTSRAFLRDPHWSRNDIYASFRNFRENSPDPEVSRIHAKSLS